MSFRAAVIALTGLAAAWVVLAQSAFDVASVKVDNGPLVMGVTGRMSGGPGSSDPGRFTVTQQTLKFFIARAYDVAADQISGPAWLDDFNEARFTIVATMPPETTKTQFQLMLQNLLAERFRLALHHETRIFAGYELVLAPGGSKLKPWTADPNASGDSAPPGGRDEQGFPRLRPNRPDSAFSMRIAGVSALVRSTNRQSIPDFAKLLGGFVNTATGAPPGAAHPRIADKTGLTGIYEFKLEFEGTVIMPGSLPVVQNAPPAASDPGQGGPTLFAALENQLGLKLVKAKEVPVDVLIIDHADKVPVEN